MNNAYNVNQLIKDVLSDLPVRHKKVIEGRYGLASTEFLTLAELGASYNLTRERIRQIESLALKIVDSKASKLNWDAFVKTTSNCLKNVGGAKREDLLINDLASLAADKDNNLSGRLKFLLEICGKFNYSKETDNFYSYWYLTAADQKKVTGFISKLISSWGSKKINDADEAYKTFLNTAKSIGLNKEVALNYAALSKNVAVNSYGDVGPADSAEINPRTSRDWAYLVLKKENRPVHFTELATLISNLKSSSVHAPTVHNELIKDNRFVLVGKGTYSLKEFGIVPGTAREIIMHYIKKHGPMKAKEVVQLVLKDRLFKENTVFINLQNKKHFKRLDDGRYTTLV